MYSGGMADTKTDTNTRDQEKDILSNAELFDESTRPDEEQRKELIDLIKNEISRLRT